jgi:hypothetical protein
VAPKHQENNQKVKKKEGIKVRTFEYEGNNLRTYENRNIKNGRGEEV